MPTAKIDKFLVSYLNKPEFRSLAREIFTDHSYYIELNTKAPTIVDIGAHIGLTTLYFKKLYPDSKITAVEPNPQSLPLLKQNLHQNIIRDVEIITAAVSDKPGEIDFYIDSKDWQSTASIHPKAWNNRQILTPIKVKALTLDQVLPTEVDLLKLDIEGAEFEVIKTSVQALKRVKHLIVEFHPRPDQPLEEFIKLLKGANFQIIDQTTDPKTNLSLIQAEKNL